MSPSHVLDEMPDWDAIARFRAGESTPDESAAIASWLQRHPSEARLLDELDRSIAPHLAGVPVSAEPIDVEAALRRVHGKIPTHASPVRPLRVSAASTRVGTGGRRVQWMIGGLAAAAVI